MNAIVTVGARFYITPDNVLWTKNGSLQYSFWTRYLDVYNEIRLIVRAKPCHTIDGDCHKASGKQILAIPVPYYEGPRQYLKVRHTIERTIASEIHLDEAIHLRLPCPIGTHVWNYLQSDRPYGVEVVADPSGIFAKNGGVNHPLRPFLRWFFTRRLKQQCVGACAAAYVSSHILPERYPTAPGAFSTTYSSVELTAKSFCSKPRMTFDGDTINLVTVGSLAQLYKAPDILIQAVNILVKEGLDLHLKFVGDGKYRPELEQQVAQLNLEKHIHFLGQLPAGDAVREQLDRADVFVLPSRTEGLPRAMIEAMARALPCIGSTAGGIPELLPLEDMVVPNHANNLAAKIREVITNPARMAQMSNRNLEKSREYQENTLRQRRNEFYQHVKGKTLKWHASSIHKGRNR